MKLTKRQTEKVALLFNSLGSEANIRILNSLPINVNDLSIDLTPMPLWRRINNLENQGLLRKEKATNPRAKAGFVYKLIHTEKAQEIMRLIEKFKEAL